MKGKLILLVFLLKILLLNSFDFSDNQLKIDVKLFEDKSVKLYVENGVISEVGSPFLIDLNGTYTFTIDTKHSSLPIESEVTYFSLRFENNRIVTSIENESVRFNQSDVKIESNQIQFLTLPVIISGYISVFRNDEYTEYCGDILLFENSNKLQVVNRVEIEKYIEGVVPNEIGISAPLEAMKAQAIASRSKILYHLTKIKKYEIYDVDATVNYQVYKGKKHVTDKVRKAVLQTKGHILIYNNLIADAVFSSCCGGKTESNHNIWMGDKRLYLQSVNDGRFGEIDLTKNSNAKKWIDKTSGTNCSPHNNDNTWKRNVFNWKKTYSKSNLAKMLGLKRIDKIKILSRGDSGRVLKMDIIGNKNLSFTDQNEIRRNIKGLKSTLFYLRLNKNEVSFIGKGSGHGVGMCQFGAVGLAEIGKDYTFILNRYYKNCNIINLEY